MQTSALLVQKTSNFLKFMVCPHEQWVEGVEQVRSFFRQGKGGQFFVILCGRLLWTAPNGYSQIPSLAFSM